MKLSTVTGTVSAARPGAEGAMLSAAMTYKACDVIFMSALQVVMDEGYSLTDTWFGP
jgi:hypothetical protein